MKILFYILIAFIAFLLLIVVRYRMSSSEFIIAESEIKYKMIDLGQDELFRNYFESLFGNRRIWLKDKPENIEFIYLDKNDFKKFYPESPITMKEKNYSFKFKFKTKKLLFGGFTKAEIVSIEKISGVPTVLKS